jgi:hypothetical protein
MASSFFTNLVTTNPLEIDIQLKDAHLLPQTMGWDENGHPEIQYLYTATDLIAGSCTIKLKQKNKVEHQGIKIELIGQVELTADKGQPYEFTALVRELEGLGEVTETKTYPFEFANVDKSYETYHGNNVRLRYFLRVKIARQVWALSKTLDFQVQNLGTEPTDNASIKMEVGIEDWSDATTYSRGAAPFTPGTSLLTSSLSSHPFCSVQSTHRVRVQQEQMSHLTTSHTIPHRLLRLPHSLTSSAVLCTVPQTTCRTW